MLTVVSIALKLIAHYYSALANTVVMQVIRGSDALRICPACYQTFARSTFMSSSSSLHLVLGLLVI